MKRKLKIGLSTACRTVGNGQFTTFKNAGIELIEISTTKAGFDTFDFGAVAAAAKDNGITLWSLHLPFHSPDELIDISKTEVCKGNIAYYTELLKKGAAIGIKNFVIHPSSEPIKDERRRDRMECSKESLETLAELAAKEGAIIAVEDLPRSCLGNCSAEMKELISVDERLRVCLDTNHLMKESLPDFIHAVGEKIITTHVSDCDDINERHWLPGEGQVNWGEVLAALGDIGYNGPWLYEVGFKCPKTIIRERDLTAEDFVRNANEIFEGKKLSVFSTPKPNIGMWE